MRVYVSGMAEQVANDAMIGPGQCIVSGTRSGYRVLLRIVQDDDWRAIAVVANLRVKKRFERHPDQHRD